MLSAIDNTDCFDVSLDKINANFRWLSQEICSLVNAQFRDLLIHTPGLLIGHVGIESPDPLYWIPCEGQTLDIADYPVLGNALKATSFATTFTVPDLSQKILTQEFSSTQVNYNKAGITIIPGERGRLFKLRARSVKGLNAGGGTGSGGNGTRVASGNVQSSIFTALEQVQPDRPQTTSALQGTRLIVTADGPNDYSVGFGKAVVGTSSKTSSKASPALGVSNPVRFILEVVSVDSNGDLIGTIDGSGSYNFSTLDWTIQVSCTTQDGFAAGIASASVIARFPRYQESNTTDTTSSSYVSLSAQPVKWYINSCLVR